MLGVWLLVFILGIVVGAGVFGRLKESNGSSSLESVNLSQHIATSARHRGSLRDLARAAVAGAQC